MRMETRRVTESQYNVVLGLCPGCESWQLDYTDEVARQFVELVCEEVHEFGSSEPIPLGFTVDTSPFHAVVEAILQEHLAECPHLQMVLDAQ